MSALTDLFTALATKIRSKTGGSDTYTPPQMVNAIDDVYQAGVDAGETPTQTKTVTAGTSAVTVTPDAGYALSSVTVNPTPSQSKVTTPTTSAQTVTPDSGNLLSQVDVAPIPSEYKIPMQIIPGNTPGAMTAGEAYSPTQNAYIIDGYTSITPSNTSPPPLYSGMIKSEGSGYAISSYSSTSKTPSPTGEYFASGWNRMTSSGYAYSSRPSMTETALWTNNSPTSSFAVQDITLSQNYTNFEYLKIAYRWSTSDSTTRAIIISKSVLDDIVGTSGELTVGMHLNSSSGNCRVRPWKITNSNTMHFASSYQTQSGGQTASNSYIIPVNVYGLKIN